METAKLAAPEIDRLVWSVHDAVGPRHGDRLASMAAGCGLDSLDLLPHFGDFLLAGALTEELATVRMRYLPPESVIARLDELDRKGLTTSRGGKLSASGGLRDLLVEMLAAQADVAERAWQDHADDVAALTDMAGAVGAAASDDHVVAVAHRSLPTAADPWLRLHQRLVTLRYVRQHDHIAVWSGRGLTVAEIVALTTLSSGEPLDLTADVAGLVSRGLVTDAAAGGCGVGLTDEGREFRDSIETETNQRAQESFDVLDASSATAFLRTLSRLPGAAPTRS